MYTTLNQIRAHNPCELSWKKGLTLLGKRTPDDEPVSIIAILDALGLDDALWCLRAVEGRDRDIRLLAVAFASEVKHLMTDPRSHKALEVAAAFANGLATAEELAAAKRDAAAAYDAAYAYAYAADAAHANANAYAYAYAADAAHATTRAAWAAAYAATCAADATYVTTRDTRRARQAELLRAACANG